MKDLRIFILLLSSVLFSIIPVKISNSCGWFYDEDEVFLAPFNTEILEIPELYPWFYSYHYYNGGETDWSEDYNAANKFSIFDGKEKNVSEWQRYFNNPAITSEDIHAVIYETSLEAFNTFDNYLNNKGKLDGNWAQNSLLKSWKQNKKNLSFEYLYFAKSIEPFVMEVDYWETVTRDIEKLTSAKEHALKRLEITKDPFLKMRYAYQAMRASHYTGSYSECRKIFERFVRNNNDSSQMYYWCLSLYAGAYWREGKFAEASYYNSIVFDKCLSRKLFSERDFWIDNETTWQKCLAMCKDDHEKNILWLLTGINQNNSAVPALYEMLKLDPSCDEIELLLAREMEKIQRNYMPVRWDDDFDVQGEYDNNRPESNDLNEIYIFITKGIATQKIKNPAFWQNAAAFIQYINKEFESCTKHLTLAKQSAGDNADLLTQARIIHVMNEIDAAGKIDESVEKNILGDVRWLYNRTERKRGDENIYFGYSQSGDAYRIVMHRLMKYYLAAGKPLQAEMCRNNAVAYYDIYEEPEKIPVDELYSYFTNKSNSAFDQFLADQYPYDADDMMEIKGSLLMQEYKWNEAIMAFKKMQNSAAHEKMQLPTDPFLIHINDCHDCDFIDHPADYTKLSLCEKIVALERLLSAKDMNHAQTYHQLANAYYNISYWGNSWMALDYYRCHGCETSSYDYTGNDWYIADLYDVSKAMEYYQLAAGSTKDKEFIALNYFMLAKCEQNNYYVSEDYSDDNEKRLKINYRTNFDKLKLEYRKTAFYKEAIDECKYFEYYVNLR
ncbi:MAG: hypothetical protein ACKVPJ_10930 [Chitinophagales bacterium]